MYYMYTYTIHSILVMMEIIMKEASSYLIQLKSIPVITHRAIPKQHLSWQTTLLKVGFTCYIPLLLRLVNVAIIC